MNLNALPGDMGPYESDRQAAETCRGIYANPPTLGYMDEANEARLLAACELAGVRLGAYDRQIIRWLAGWEPETVTVVTGLILRSCKAHT